MRAAELSRGAAPSVFNTLNIVFLFPSAINIASPKEKAVALLDGDVVGVQDLFPAGERGDQHDERTLRQVEIRDERIHGLESVAGIDENIRPGGGLMEEPVLIRKRFQRPAGCRANADDPAAGARSR